MPQAKKSWLGAIFGLALIGACVVVAAGAFAYTAGVFSPDRITSFKLIEALAPPQGAFKGFRRNHAKGICFAGTFAANGNGTALSRAEAFAAGTYPVIGRFNLGTNDPYVADAKVRVRGMGLQIVTPGGETWRSAMINLPFFPVSNPDAFYGLLTASKSTDPDAMKNFVAANPEFGNFAQWAGSAPWTGSFAEEAYNSLNSFVFVGPDGARQTVRWSLKPQAEVQTISNEELTQLGPNHLESEIAQRVAAAPQKWTMGITVADPGDPTDDPSKAWPDGRRTVDVGVLTVDSIAAEYGAPCRNLNFDPTILPAGIEVSDDPFPAARSSAYARSYDLRTAEAKDFPHDYLEAEVSTKP